MAALIFALLDHGRPGALATSPARLSALAGFVGMTIATQANARTANAASAARHRALPLAFRGGAVMGFTVAGLALSASPAATSCSPSGWRSTSRSR